MNVNMDGAVIVTLSERNIADLVRQAETDSNPFISAESGVKAQLVRDCVQPDGSYVRLLVQVEEDANHYGARTPGPGGFIYS